MDERIVPDAAIGTEPGTPPPGQTAPQPVAVTQVAVFPLVTETGEFQNAYAILERFGSEYVVTQYDANTNTLHTGTNSIDTAVYVPATPALDALMQTYGMPGSMNNLAFVDANANVQTPTVSSGVIAPPPLGNPVPQPPGSGVNPNILLPYPSRVIIIGVNGNVIVITQNPYPDDPLFPNPPAPWIPNPWRPFPPVGGGPLAPLGPIGQPPRIDTSPLRPGWRPADGTPFNPNQPPAWQLPPSWQPPSTVTPPGIIYRPF